MSGSRPVTPKLPKQKCPAALLRDLRGVAAFRALEIVYQKHDSVKDDVKHTLMGIIDLNNQILKRNDEMLQFTKDNRGKGTRVASAVLKVAEEERMGIVEDHEVEVLE